MIGAPAMAGTAALRMGTGLVQVAVPKSVLPFVLSITPELIGLGLTGKSLKDLRDAAKKSAAIVVGPGLGQSNESRRRAFELFRLKKPMVVDADALNMLAQLKKWPSFFQAQAVLTPHPGEMKRLIGLLGKSQVPTDDSGRLRLAVDTAKAFNQVLVLKGSKTVVTDGVRSYVNHTGDSSLAKAGTGDVLSGMIGTLLGQKMDGFDAACLAVHLHGRAGELAGKKYGIRSVLAHEVILSLASAIEEYTSRKK
jgi:ADP-dependent NAD(P)H-hydrate dehydratase